MIDLPDKFGMTLLHKSAAVNAIARCALLLKCGANVNVRSSSGTTPLHCAARSDPNGKLCELLLEHKAELNVQDMDGWTPLHVAADSRNWEVCKMLLSRGADCELLNWECESPSRIAHSHGNARVKAMFRFDFEL